MRGRFIAGLLSAPAFTAPAHADDCFVTPKDAMEAPIVSGDELWHVLVDLQFAGSPKDPPLLTVVYSNAPSLIQAEVKKHLLKYRFVCRKKGDSPYMAQQMFTFSPPGRHAMAPPEYNSLDIASFISTMKFEADDAVTFDFDAMACPFVLGYTLLDQQKQISFAGGTSDEVTERRLPLLRWLNRHGVNYQSPRVANEWVGQTIELRVPCGQLNLKDLRAKKGLKTFPP